MRSRSQPQAGQPPDQTAAVLAKSLESTRRGLALFLESLERSGFKDAVAAYQQMHLVLLQQRLWARAHRRRELEPLFEAIRAAAGSIHRILSGLAAAMEGVRRLDAPPVAAPDKRALEPVGAAALLEQMLARVSVSAWRVARDTGGRGCAALEQLTEAGLLAARGRGRGRSFRLSPAVCRGLAVWLCEPAEGSVQEGD